MFNMLNSLGNKPRLPPLLIRAGPGNAGEKVNLRKAGTIVKNHR
jgi:hypothetical protein